MSLLLCIADFSVCGVDAHRNTALDMFDPFYKMGRICFTEADF